MFFDILRGTWAENEDFFTYCLDCERNVRTDPDTSAVSARKALESFVDILLERNGVVIPDSMDERKAQQLETLYERITKCYSLGIINRFQNSLFHEVRKKANKAAHEGNVEVSEAVMLFKDFYTLFISVVTKTPANKIEIVKAGQNLEDWLPIDEYEVVAVMNRGDKSDDKIPTYKCVLSDNKKMYAIIRRYKKDNADDVRQIRDILAMRELKINFANVSHKPVESEEISVASNCKYRYIKYVTGEKTIMLSQTKDFKNLKISSSNILQIMENIVDILNSLTDIGDGVSLHHRALSPTSVFITPNKNGYNVQIGNFECSKVKDENNNITEAATVFEPRHIERIGGSVYMPPEVRDGAILDISDPDWEQIDVYSCAVMLLYLSFKSSPSSAKLMDWLNKLKPYFSAEVINMTKDILTSPYGSRPTLNEYLKVIRKEAVMRE